MTEYPLHYIFPRANQFPHIHYLVARLALDLHVGADHDADQLRQEIQTLLSHLFK